MFLSVALLKSGGGHSKVAASSVENILGRLSRQTHLDEISENPGTVTHMSRKPRPNRRLWVIRITIVMSSTPMIQGQAGWRHCDKSDTDFGVNLSGRRLCGVEVAALASFSPCPIKQSSRPWRKGVASRITFEKSGFLVRPFSQQRCILQPRSSNQLGILVPNDPRLQLQELSSIAIKLLVQRWRSAHHALHRGDGVKDEIALGPDIVIPGNHFWRKHLSRPPKQLGPGAMPRLPWDLTKFS
ncbi:hypothetical protein DFH07DRAFT_781172 [Mycena maculata]|uniref:Uncharacterized protein n=1 Tax=Mycena maculata TaxID=230809 RepID=A0AAD7MUU0_9AGAR|nr:hypothetical protein DFH07DRAFT_781172 [Mycena maculata]